MCSYLAERFLEEELDQIQGDDELWKKFDGTKIDEYLKHINAEMGRVLSMNTSTSCEAGRSRSGFLAAAATIGISVSNGVVRE